jgi:gluconokinase
VRDAAPGVVFVHLSGDRALIEDRMSHRQGHFMPTTLLDSQFATLQPLGEDEAGVTVSVAGSPEEITERASAALAGVETPSR